MTLARRIARLEHPSLSGSLPAWVQVLAAEVATEAGLDPAEVVREAEAILAHANAAGVWDTGEDPVAFMAAEAGVAPDVLLAEAQRLMAHQ
jgi:hypothetical protein